ncbi:hypothetical protein [Muriicola marianensis]|uniref:Uncharacterized protein n=1 Tax=Muriicola marianensis TaxID=1324801 RepID=A0ABQ1QW40_9FLAO|nr:hypothetical protein [Muriicola marianensis]GGD47954.1 hypothetical protein GCM10011361_13430 [Muriicola marianensis]
MTTLKSILIFICVLSVVWGYAQGDGTPVSILDFYQEMALNDAQMEASLRFSSPEDEADYWKDQLFFEKQLKEKEYTAYKTYIFYKRKAYRMHQEGCDIKANHGKGYNLQARFYHKHGSTEEEEKMNASGDLKPVSLVTRWH